LVNFVNDKAKMVIYVRILLLFDIMFFFTKRHIAGVVGNMTLASWQIY